MKAKVVIVGGGVMGVAIAWHCARRADPLSQPIVLLEKTSLAAGASGRSGAILRQHYSDRVVAAMARDSLRVYSTFERKTGRAIGFQKSGVITLAGPSRPDDIALVERNIVMQREIGIDTRRIDAHEMRRLVPGIRVDDGSIGAYEPDGGGVDPVLTVQAIAALAREHGAITRIGTACSGLIVSAGRVIGVHTDDGDIEAEHVVIAAGPWTKRFFSRAGVALPLRVVRPEQHFLAMPSSLTRESSARIVSADERTARDGEKHTHSAREPGVDRSQRERVDERSDRERRAEGSVLERASERAGLEPSGREPMRPLSFEDEESLEQRFGLAPLELAPPAHPVVLDLERGFYTRCESHASREGLPAPRTRVGRMDHSHDVEIDDPDAVDERVSSEFKRWARESLEQRFAAYRSQPDVGSFVGLYNMTPDAQALIGPLDELPGVFVVSGFSGHGFKLAPSIGEGVAQILWNEPVSAFDTEFFAPQRFAEGRARSGRAFGL
jgi:glycine/D-amino acid oxidase-like deaminating enzyme